MDKFIELDLSLINGDEYYICDRAFVVMREHRNRPDEHHLLYDACSVNGFAVMEKYSEVLEMIREAKGAK